jgi:hypothetical protein
MVLLSAQGMDVPAIAKVAFTSKDRVRDVIRNFNADGFGSLYPPCCLCRSARRCEEAGLDLRRSTDRRTAALATASARRTYRVSRFARHPDPLPGSASFASPVLGDEAVVMTIMTAATQDAPSV